MEFKDLDMTVSQVFSKGFDQDPRHRHRKFQSPREKAKSGRPQFNVLYTGMLNESKLFDKIDKLKGVGSRTPSNHRHRMEQMGHSSLIPNGTLRDAELEAAIYQDTSSTICDCCGSKIERLPWTIPFQVGNLCMNCSADMDRRYGAMRISGPWDKI